MRLAPIARLKSRFSSSAPLDCTIAMALLIGAALTILPMMFALATFALIAAVARGFTPTFRALPERRQ